MHCKKGNRDFTFSRLVAESALAVYVENGLSVKTPVQCLDLSLDREEGSKWESKHGTSVTLMGPNSNSNKSVQDLADEIVESNYAVIEKTDFNFIYVECTTEGSSYFDCVFRKLARSGLFALATSDDPALYGRPAEPALRCYGGLIARTFYAPEMAVRLIIAAMARSAARFSKSIEILLTAVIKNSITILVRVKKGADSSVKCVKEIKTLIHCTVCEERAFLPGNDGYLIDDVSKYLSCGCAGQSVGRTMLGLGPLWAGALGCPGYITALLPHTKHSLQASAFLQDLVTELRCKSKETFRTDDSCEKSFDNSPAEGNPLKRKAECDNGDVKSKIIKLDHLDCEPAPAFYYNLHKHKPKGCQKLLKADKIIEMLHQHGHRAGRTHFDRAAIKTSCTLHDLHNLLSRDT